MLKRALQSSVELACPYCGQVSPVLVDEGGGEEQTYVEDCSVCCRPRTIHLSRMPLEDEGSSEPRIWCERGG